MNLCVKILSLCLLLTDPEPPYRPPEAWTAQTKPKVSSIVAQDFQSGAKGWKVMLEIKKKDFPSGHVPKAFDLFLIVPEPENWKYDATVVFEGKEERKFGLFHLYDNNNVGQPYFYIEGFPNPDKDGPFPPPDLDFQIRVYLIPKKEGMDKPTVEARTYSHPKVKR